MHDYDETDDTSILDDQRGAALDTIAQKCRSMTCVTRGAGARMQSSLLHHVDVDNGENNQDDNDANNKDAGNDDEDEDDDGVGNDAREASISMRTRERLQRDNDTMTTRR